MFGEEEEAQSVNVTLPSCELVCVFIYTCFSMCVFVCVKAQVYCVWGQHIESPSVLLLFTACQFSILRLLHTYTQHTLDNTAFAKELSVETSLYDDGTVREAELTFTVSGTAIFVHQHK